MTQGQPISNESVQSKGEGLREQPLTSALIDRILQKLSCIELPAKDHLERYMRHKWRINHKPKTLASSFTSVMFFLGFYGKSGKRGREGTFVQSVHGVPTLPSISIIKCLADGGKRIRVKRLDYGGMLRPNLNHESQRRFLGGCEQNIPDPPTFLSFQTPNHRPEIN